jgi:hypothetical protein
MVLYCYTTDNENVRLVDHEGYGRNVFIFTL